MSPAEGQAETSVSSGISHIGWKALLHHRLTLKAVQTSPIKAQPHTLPQGSVRQGPALAEPYRFTSNTASAAESCLINAHPHTPPARHCFVGPLQPVHTDQPETRPKPPGLASSGQPHTLPGLASSTPNRTLPQGPVRQDPASAGPQKIILKHGFSHRVSPHRPPHTLPQGPVSSGPGFSRPQRSALKRGFSRRVSPHQRPTPHTPRKPCFVRARLQPGHKGQPQTRLQPPGKVVRPETTPDGTLPRKHTIAQAPF